MSLSFQRASKKSARLRMALIGVAGSGKTYTALSIAQHLGKKVAVLDTERGSASKYSDLFEFDVLEPENFSPKTYIDAIEAAAEAGYDVIILDSLSHAWTGQGGALEMVDKAARRSQTSNTFGAWRDVTPLHNAMVDAMIGAKIHIIATMRAKTEYVQERDKNGKTTVRKVGMAPVQRDGLEYEFDVVADLDQDNNFIVGKTRCSAIAGMVVNKAGREVATKLNAWLSDGVAPTPEKFAPAVPVEAREAAMPVTSSVTPPVATSKPAAKTSSTRSRIAAHMEDAAQTTVAPGEAEVDFAVDIADSMHCHCGVEARYVKGKSGNGWVCGDFGTDDACDFRKKDSTPEPVIDVFDDAESDVVLNGKH